jgi:3D (Asp-Asp-Asp) domain-containing protein
MSIKGGVSTRTPAVAGSLRGSGNVGSLGKFVSTAYGPPWTGIQGTGMTATGVDLRDGKKAYGVAVDPKVIPLGTELYIWPNPFNYKGTFLAFDTGGAIKGNRIDFYDWRGRASQQKWGVKDVQAGKTQSVLATGTNQGIGGVSLPSIPNPLKWADEMGKAIVGLVYAITDPKEWGTYLANATAWMLKHIGKALYSVVIEPPFRWSQRATIYYYEHRIIKGGRRYISKEAFVTMGFWAFGFAILWGKLDTPELGVDARDSSLAKTIRSGHNVIAGRRIVAPKDVKKKTPTKPNPHISKVPLATMRVVSANRRRTVTVTDKNGNRELGRGTDPQGESESQKGSSEERAA